jgi:hypothetical protein
LFLSVTIYYLDRVPFFYLFQATQPVASSIGKNLLRGALLRIASDLSGGTPLESIKCRATVSKDNMFEAYRHIIQESGILGLWSGTPSRTVEGALLGALFILGSTVTKKQVIKMGGSPLLAALAGGTVGGIAQAFVMTPAGTRTFLGCVITK